MTIQEFFDKWNGKGIDFDNFYGDQCMDLACQYNQDVIGAPRLTGNAIDVWTTYPVDFYTQITNTPDGIPQKGDIVIWGTSIGTYGHIAVFSEGDINQFTSFDQNWPIGSICHFQQHDYNGVLGWLHPKNLPLDQSTQLAQANADRDTNWNSFVALCNELGVAVDINNKQNTVDNAKVAIIALKKKGDDLINENTGLKTQISQVNQLNANLASQIKDIQASDSTAIDAGLKAESDLKDATATLTAIQSKIQAKSTSMIDMLAALDTILIPQDQTVKYVSSLHKALDELLYKRTPSGKSIKLIDMIKALWSKSK